jgi:deoxycytidylate deaminase
MDIPIYTLMQQAVDAVAESEHPTNKIAAAIAGKSTDGKDFAIAAHNFWPVPIKAKIGTETDIGNSSGTVHAETACLLQAPMTDNSAMFVTDPPCPNCVKNMTEAGVKTLYIDHKGFDKDFALRRGEDVRDLSLEICKKAGINVFKIFRKEKRVENIVHIVPGYMPVIEKRARAEILQEPSSEEFFKILIEKERAHYKDRPFAVALAADALSKITMVSAEIHAVAGFTAKTASIASKYDLLLQPVHRVLMTAARYGLKIQNGFIYCSRVPTAREQVNLVGSGINNIYLGNDETARDEYGLQAVKQLTIAGILTVKNF